MKAVKCGCLVINVSGVFKNGSSSAAIAEDRHNLALYLPLVVPLTLRNINGIHLRVSRLQAHSIALFLLEESLQGSATVALQVDSNYYIAIFTRVLPLDYHVIFIADMILDHRLTFDNQGIGSLLLNVSPCIK